MVCEGESEEVRPEIRKDRGGEVKHWLVEVYDHGDWFVLVECDELSTALDLADECRDEGRIARYRVA